MKVVAMLGGLGSQMFKYAFYLAVREQTDQECLIDTAPFDAMEMWNGYELERIFGIREPDLKEAFSEEEWKLILGTKEEYNRMCALKHMAEKTGAVQYYNRGIPVCYRSRGNVFQDFFYRLQCAVRGKRISKGMCDKYPGNFAVGTKSAYFDEFDHRSDYYFRDYASLVKKAFVFPEFTREEDRKISEEMKRGNSVALHVRRSDHMYDNGDLFERGYYRQAAGFIKENTAEKQTFYLFSDDLQWCLGHLADLGLEASDPVVAVDWNHGADSFRDMQLMTFCQHNIIPISSFSWWGYYLSSAADKIVCAPEGYWLEVENHF